MKKVVGLVTVRTESSRLPEKAFRTLSGIPLIEMLTGRLSGSDALDDFIVCTTTSPADDRIEEFCRERGYSVYRGQIEDVLGRFVGALRRMPSEYVVRITGDNPLSDFETMCVCLERLEEHGTDYSRPIGVPLGTACEVVRTTKLVELHERTITHDLTEYMTYFFEMAPFIATDTYEVGEELRFPELRLTVDYEADLAFLERVLAHFGGCIPSLAETVALCRTLDDPPLVHEDVDAAAAIKHGIVIE